LTHGILDRMRQRLIHSDAEARHDLVWRVATEQLRPLLPVPETLPPPEAAA
jgi:hypothetical protein